MNSLGQYEQILQKISGPSMYFKIVGELYYFSLEGSTTHLDQCFIVSTRTVQLGLSSILQPKNTHHGKKDDSSPVELDSI